ncbi:MAG: hypothetical protein II507_07070, partial [Treponema sp.]|nr:hypothetical protein [Treponema sp.]
TRQHRLQKNTSLCKAAGNQLWGVTGRKIWMKIHLRGTTWQCRLQKNTSLCKAAGNQFSDILHAIAMVYGCSGRQVLLHKKMCGEEGGKGGLA